MQIRLEGSVETLPDGSIVDYGVYIEKETLVRLIQSSVQGSTRGEQKITCILKTNKRPGKVLPPLHVRLGLPKVACGDRWHYEGHTFHSICPTCGSNETAQPPLTSET